MQIVLAPVTWQKYRVWQLWDVEAGGRGTSNLLVIPEVSGSKTQSEGRFPLKYSKLIKLNKN
jgi:hypothetical protein